MPHFYYDGGYYSFDFPNLKIASLGKQATKGWPDAFID